MKKILIFVAFAFCNCVTAQSIVLDNYKQILASIKQIKFPKHTRSAQLSNQINKSFKYNGVVLSKDSVITIFNSSCDIAQVLSFEIIPNTGEVHLSYTIDYEYPAPLEIVRKTLVFDDLGLVINTSYVDCFYNIYGGEDSVFFSEDQPVLGRVVTSKLINKYANNSVLPDSTIIYNILNNNIYISTIEANIFDASNKLLADYLFVADANNTMVQNCRNFYSYTTSNEKIDSFQKWENTSQMWVNNRLSISKMVSCNLQYIVNANFQNTDSIWVLSDSTNYFYSNHSTFDSMLVKNNAGIAIFKSNNIFDVDGNNITTDKYKWHGGNMYKANVTDREFNTCKALSIQNILSESNVIFFPNPVFTNSDLNVSSPFSNGFNLKLIDVYGKEISKYKFSLQNGVIKSPILKGIYFLIFTDQESRSLGSQKIIVQ
jgi:hypothetical protein